jgi:hypothetical protein
VIASVLDTHERSATVVLNPVQLLAPLLGLENHHLALESLW